MTLAETLERRQLATLSGRLFLTDGGIELVLIHHEGIDLPHMSAFPLLETAEGRGRLDAYTRPYLEIARRHGAGYVHETPTWRGSWGWTAGMGYSMARTVELNRLAVGIGRTLAHRNPDLEIVVSGNVGPRGDGYAPDELMTPEQAADYHAHQIDAFVDGGADLATALTITHAGEAAGIALAAREAGLPVVISFTVETDGRLPSGQPLGEAIGEVDAGVLPQHLGQRHPAPRGFEVDLGTVALDPGATEHPLGDLRDELLEPLGGDRVVGVRIVPLQHRELGVVLGRDALVAEVLAELVDAVDAADDAALEI